MRTEGFKSALLSTLIAVSIIVPVISLIVPATSPLGPTFVQANPENTIVIVILHTNDVHSHLLPEGGVGGSAYVASIVDNERAQHPGRVLLLDAGDLVDGDPVGDLFYGRSVIEVMNAMGYDAMTVGNHELGRYGGDYDYGVISIENDYLMDLKGIAEFPLLAANVLIDDSRPFESYVIKEIDNIKIGIIGATVYFPPPENVQILEPENAARECVEEIGNQVDLIIALTHLGKWDDRSLASNVENIDIIIGGHSHTVMWEPENVGDTKIVQAGAYGKYVGRICLEFNAENHENYNFSYNLIEVKHPPLEENQGIAEMVENYNNIISPIIDIEIGYTENTLYRPETGENVAESFRENTGADVGYQNYGGIRDYIPAGDITIRQIHKVLPYGNKLMSMDLRGDYLKGQFGYGYVAGAYEENSQWYLENGEPIEDDEYYRVATSEYVGTRYGFTNGKNITYHGLCRDAFIDYVKEVFPAADPDPPIHIHLTWGENDTSHTMVVTWKTVTTEAGDNVLYDTEPRGGDPELYGYSATGSHHTYSGAGGYIHDVELTGLSPNTRYYFICGGENGGYSAERSFRTAPEASTNIRFVAGGDSRSGGDWPGPRDAISRAMAKFNPSFVLFTGDFIRTWNDQAEWDNWFAAAHEYWIDNNGLTIPIIPCIGNHEMPTGTNYYEQFFLPSIPSDEQWYSLDWGPDLHIIVLNSETSISGEQLDWLRSDLAAHEDYMWKIAIFHRPAYSSGAHGPNGAIQQAWCPVFDNYHVDLVFSGHDHIYERTYPIYENTVQSSPSEGTVYVVSGGWGAPLYSGSPNWWTAHGPDSKYHFVTIDISEKGGLHLRAVDAEGVTFDEYYIHKENYWAEVSISPSENSGLPSENLTYIVTVTNVGALADNYYLTVSDNENWNLTLSENLLGNIGPGENGIVTLSVTVPENAISCTEDKITVTAASIADNEVSVTDSCIAHAISPKAEFSFVTLYKVGLDAKLYLENGSKLVVKFYTYGDVFENENIVWSGTTPAHVKENENVLHPSGIGIKKVRLDLTYDNTENVISTLASFTITRSTLMERIAEIDLRWPYASFEERSVLMGEISGIDLQWPYAPF